MKGFRPFGIPHCKTGTVVMKYEEYESIRLINYQNLDQEDAAGQMNISRPTFTRIYNSALKQIARSFVEGKAIVIAGGNYHLENEWFRCKKCFRLIEGIENHRRCENCTSYGEDELLKLN